jgi:transcriptional regulator of NAD metabolism
MEVYWNARKEWREIVAMNSSIVIYILFKIPATYFGYIRRYNQAAYKIIEETCDRNNIQIFLHNQECIQVLIKVEGKVQPITGHDDPDGE